MLNKLLLVAAVLPAIVFADMQNLRKELHFKLYEELTANHPYATREHWVSIGRAQAFSDVIISIDLELLELEP